MSLPRLAAIVVALLVGLLLHNAFGWGEGWALSCGLATLLVLHPVSIGVERGLADKQHMDELLEKIRDNRTDS